MFKIAILKYCLVICCFSYLIYHLLIISIYILNNLQYLVIVIIFITVLRLKQRILLMFCIITKIEKSISLKLEDRSS